MSNFRLSNRSLNRLVGVNSSLVDVVHRAIDITEIDFGVLEGVRSLARQKILFETGASQTMNSRHITGDAVDLFAYVDGTISWEWKYYEKINEAMQKASQEEFVEIEWGGNWTTLKDGVHFQLPRTSGIAPSQLFVEPRGPFIIGREL